MGGPRIPVKRTTISAQRGSLPMDCALRMKVLWLKNGQVAMTKSSQNYDSGTIGTRSSIPRTKNFVVRGIISERRGNAGSIYDQMSGTRF